VLGDGLLSGGVGRSDNRRTEFSSHHTSKLLLVHAIAERSSAPTGLWGFHQSMLIPQGCSKPTGVGYAMTLWEPNCVGRWVVERGCWSFRPSPNTVQLPPDFEVLACSGNRRTKFSSHGFLGLPQACGASTSLWGFHETVGCLLSLWRRAGLQCGSIRSSCRHRGLWGRSRPVPWRSGWARR
jgi:hypothetical protein